jgi:hypothetical protein
VTFAIQLWGYLILTVLAFVTPVMTVLLSIFPDGRKGLHEKLENERKNSEENIRNETARKESDAHLDIPALEATLDSLRKNKQEAESRLRFLRPTEAIARIGGPFVVAFLSAVIALFQEPLGVTIIALVVSVAAFIYGVSTLFIGISVLSDISEIVSTQRSSTEALQVELLSRLVELSGPDKLFLKESDFHLHFNGKELSEGQLVEFSVGKKYDVPVAVWNASDLTAKKFVLGFSLPKSCLIEKEETFILVSSNETEQIVRYNVEVLAGSDEMALNGMSVTFLTSGDYKIRTFVSAENIRYFAFHFTLRIVE